VTINYIASFVVGTVIIRESPLCSLVEKYEHRFCKLITCTTVLKSKDIVADPCIILRPLHKNIFL
jgi:hypothetical protein